MENPLARFDHPAWHTGIATALSYGLVLAFLFVLLFVMPYLIFALML
jgi:hypothetical protein